MPDLSDRWQNFLSELERRIAQFINGSIPLKDQASWILGSIAAVANAYLGEALEGGVQAAASTGAAAGAAAGVAPLRGQIVARRDEVNAFTASKSGEVGALVTQGIKHTTDLFNVLSKQISGGSGGSDEALRAAALHLGAILEQLVRVVDVDAVGRLEALNGILAGGLRALREDTTGNFRALVTALGGLVVQIAAALPPQLGALLVQLLQEDWPKLREQLGAGGVLARALGGEPVTEEQIVLAGFVNPAVLKAIINNPWVQRVALAAGFIFQEQVKRVGEIILSFFPGGSDTAERVAAGAGRWVIQLIELLHAPMRAVMARGTALLFEQLDAELDAIGQATPANVLPHASRLVTIAGSLGMSAHLLSVAASSVPGLKDIGLSQLAAFLVDFSGFQTIARNTFGIQFEAALASPARRRAFARFRPNVPDLRVVQELFLERLISAEEFRGHLREMGWSEGRIEQHLVAVFREATPRDMAAVFEDAEVDPEWILRHLQQSGYSDADAERIARGVITRARRSPRGRIIAAVLDNLEAGIYDEDTAASYLRGLGISQEVAELHLASAAHRRLGDELDDVRRVWIDAAALGQVDLGDLEAALAAFGFDARARRQAGLLAQARLSARLFRDEQTELKAAVRRTQADEVQALTEAFRRDALDAGTLRAALLALGVDVREVDAVVQLQVVRRAPVPRAPEVLSPAAAAQRARDLEADAVLERQRKGQLDAAGALAALLALGVERAEAEASVRLIAARTLRPVDEERVQQERADVAEARRARTDAALTYFREGLITESTLRALLRDAGNAADVVDAIAVREVARRQVDVVRDAERVNERRLREQLDALERAELEAFRQGRLDGAGLLVNLVALGRPPATAEAIVRREELERSSAAAREEELRRARGDAERARVLEQAILEGYRADLLSDDELVSELIALGRAADVAQAILARERARRVGAGA